MSKCLCGKWSIYGLPGGKPIWCFDCKSEDGVDIKNKKCKCGKAQPSLGLMGETAKWCSKCPDKPSEATNVVSKKCICGKTQPIYGFFGETAKWCSKCPDKPSEAINVVSKKCDCGKAQPNFGLPGEKAQWCSKCKPDNAIDVTHTKCLCGKARPNFGLPGGKSRWCSVCKPEDAINVSSPMCSGYGGIPCPVKTQLKSGKSYCISCDPDTSRRLPRKKDEHAFFCFLEKHNIKVTQREYRIDYRCVDTSKSHAFIDGVIITPDIVICLEVDEDAHKRYDCDEARTNFASTELLLAFPDHYISWVRVNPTIGNFDRRDKALKIRDERYFEAVLLIRKLLERPRMDTIYIGY
jgi:hypothetical protein